MQLANDHNGDVSATWKNREVHDDLKIYTNLLAQLLISWRVSSEAPSLGQIRYFHFKLLCWQYNHDEVLHMPHLCGKRPFSLMFSLLLCKFWTFSCMNKTFKLVILTSQDCLETLWVSPLSALCHVCCLNYLLQGTIN